MLRVLGMKEIGYIGNYYGGLITKEENGKFYWIIKNYDTDFDNLREWKEISKELYRELIKHNKRNKLSRFKAWEERNFTNSSPSTTERIRRARQYLNFIEY